jgi:hypothetical protein
MKTVFVIAHVLFACFGVGGALMMDVFLLRHLRGRIVAASDRSTIDFMALFVKGGLVGIWASGIAILAASPDGAAAILANPKVQAKLVVVVVLTLNALFIETMALPLVHRNVGRRLFDGVGEVRRIVLLGCGTVSATSWCTPLVLGLARELNHVVPAGRILAVYAGALLIAGVAAQLGVRLLYRKPLPGPAAAVEPEPASVDAAETVPTPQAAARARIAAAFAADPAKAPPERPADPSELYRQAEAALQRIEARLASRPEARRRTAG